MEKVINEAKIDEPFVGMIRIQPEAHEEISATKQHKQLVTELVFGSDGSLNLKKSLYDMNRIPKGVEDPELEMAQKYDTEPVVEVIPYDRDLADSILSRVQEVLEQQVKEDEIFDEEDMSLGPREEEDKYFGTLETKRELEKVKKARQTISTSSK